MTSESFWSRVSIGPVDSCWPWTGSRNGKGYGLVSRPGRSPRRWPAPRVAWELAYGTIPPGKWVLHSCDNPRCCNPRHLWLGTPAENSADRNSKGRQAKGETDGTAKLTEVEVLAIRSAVATGATQSTVADLYGVTQSLIHLIAVGKKWSHVGGPRTKIGKGQWRRRPIMPGQGVGEGPWVP